MEIYGFDIIGNLWGLILSILLGAILYVFVKWLIRKVKE